MFGWASWTFEDFGGVAGWMFLGSANYFEMAKLDEGTNSTRYPI